MKKERKLRLDKNFIPCDVFENEEYYPNIIDGNHRLEKAYRDRVKTIISYKLMAEQMIPYFIDVKDYQAFVGYWNDKLYDL